MRAHAMTPDCDMELKTGRMLLVVDPQIDFVSGSLPVPGAAEAMDSLATYILSNPQSYDLKIVTADNHPFNHSSFADAGGKWSRHCVRSSVGAAIYPAVFDALHATRGDTLLLYKGEDAAKEEYSVFQAPGAADFVAKLVGDMGITAADICGLAGDVCVLSTLRDAIALFPDIEFRVLAAYSPSIDGGASLDSFIDQNSLICIR